MLLHEGQADLMHAAAAYSFSQLLVNTVCALCDARKKGRGKWLFAAGLLLFLGCDICVGLRNLAVPYAVREAAYALNWVFYLPSQVLICLGESGDVSRDSLYTMSHEKRPH